MLSSLLKSCKGRNSNWNFSQRPTKAFFISLNSLLSFSRLDRKCIDFWITMLHSIFSCRLEQKCEKARIFSGVLAISSTLLLKSSIEISNLWYSSLRCREKEKWGTWCLHLFVFLLPLPLQTFLYGGQGHLFNKYEIIIFSHFFFS